MQRFNKDAGFPTHYTAYGKSYGSLFSDYWIGMLDLRKLAAGKTVIMLVEMYTELKHEKIVQEYFNVSFIFNNNANRITYTSYTGTGSILTIKISILQIKICYWQKNVESTTVAVSQCYFYVTVLIISNVWVTEFTDLILIAITETCHPFSLPFKLNKPQTFEEN